MKPTWCGVISAAAEFVVGVAGVEAKHACEVVSAVAEFMVDVAGMKSEWARSNTRQVKHHTTHPQVSDSLTPLNHIATLQALAMNSATH
jgi:hypothetical protein